jgi:hypothetical protein
VLGVDEHGQGAARGAAPELARLHRLSGERPPAPFGADRGAAQPRAGVRVEAADLFEDEGGQLRRVGGALEEVAGAPPQLALDVPLEGRRREARHGAQALRVEQQAAMAELRPAGHLERSGGSAHCAGSGRRISTHTGKTWTGVGMA